MDAHIAYLVGTIRAYDDAGRLVLKAADGKINLEDALDIINASKGGMVESLHFRLFEEIDNELYGE